jgi:hypothetical protein
MSALSGILDAMNQTSLSIREVATFKLDEMTRLGELYQLVVELDARLDTTETTGISAATAVDEATNEATAVNKTAEISRSIDAMIEEPASPSDAALLPDPFPKSAEISCPDCGMLCRSKAGLAAHRRHSHIRPAKPTTELPTPEVATSDSESLDYEDGEEDDGVDIIEVPSQLIRPRTYAERVRANPF